MAENLRSCGTVGADHKIIESRLLLLPRISTAASRNDRKLSRGWVGGSLETFTEKKIIDKFSHAEKLNKCLQ